VQVNTQLIKSEVLKKGSLSILLTIELSQDEMYQFVHSSCFEFVLVDNSVRLIIILELQ